MVVEIKRTTSGSNSCSSDKSSNINGNTIKRGKSRKSITGAVEGVRGVLEVAIRVAKATVAVGVTQV